MTCQPQNIGLEGEEVKDTTAISIWMSHMIYLNQRVSLAICDLMVEDDDNKDLKLKASRKSKKGK